MESSELENEHCSLMVNWAWRDRYVGCWYYNIPLHDLRTSSWRAVNLRMNTAALWTIGPGEIGRYVVGDVTYHCMTLGRLHGEQ